jgi:hypothetical protein
MVVEGINWELQEAKRRGDLHGVFFSQTLKLSHLLFVDDVLIFYSSQRRDVEKLNIILEIFNRATCM